VATLDLWHNRRRRSRQSNQPKGDLERSSLGRSALVVGQSSSPVPLSWGGPPRLQGALSCAWTVAVVLEGPVPMTVGLTRAGPLDVVPSRASFTRVGRPLWAKPVPSLRPPLCERLASHVYRPPYSS
jgi:hypothetical protein